MKIGDIISISITNLGAEGEGIGRTDGLAVFVGKTFPGDEVSVRITQTKKSYAKAELVEILKASNIRIKPECPHYKECGGCTFQEMAYQEQLVHKQERVKEALRRIGGIADPKVEDIFGMKSPYHYRNKAQFPIKDGKIGYFKAKSHDIVPIEECMLQSDPAVALARAFGEFLKQHPKNIYRHLVVKTAVTGEVMAILVANKNDISRLEELVDCLDVAVVEPYSLESLILNINKKTDAQVMGQECITLAGKSHIDDILETDNGKLKLEILPLSFYQTNSTQTSALYSLVHKYADPKPTDTILDLYCGAGSIGLSLASKVARVIGVESVRPAVLNANRNAVINGIVNAEFVLSKAEDVFETKLMGVKADTVILDPPRVGCDIRLLESIKSIAPQKIVYVSCNPATLARDIKILSEDGSYQFVEATPIDMFPWTVHVEVVIKMQKCGLEDEK
ncbi:MAG: 23S rRNA (uracil(1939)-C(5))-methyltransferase RlmD [Clostridia bacterium]|nr:23S rRNA (uracil(1939)-C(5))-methyltransferase RlmD [Clostridia bacterium]